MVAGTGKSSVEAGHASEDGYCSACDDVMIMLASDRKRGRTREWREVRGLRAQGGPRMEIGARWTE